MPELPEVETVLRVIAPQVIGRSIRAVRVQNAQVIAHPQADSFTRQLVGQTIASMSRRGKFLTLHMESGDRLCLHLRMTGQLLAAPKDFPIEKHTHLIFALSDESELRYIDVRRFGRFWLLQREEPDTLTGQSSLGLEPDDAALTADYLNMKLGGRKKAIKEMLLDQSVVAGIGNIYSDEILFAARIHPSAKCAALTPDQWRRLAGAIPEVIAWAIEKNRITPEEYLLGKGKEYRNTPFLQVYGRAGLPCPVCKGALCRQTIGGRSSVFCAFCQEGATC